MQPFLNHGRRGLSKTHRHTLKIPPAEASAAPETVTAGPQPARTHTAGPHTAPEHAHAELSPPRASATSSACSVLPASPRVPPRTCAHSPFVCHGVSSPDPPCSSLPSPGPGLTSCYSQKQDETLLTAAPRPRRCWAVAGALARWPQRSPRASQGHAHPRGGAPDFPRQAEQRRTGQERRASLWPCGRRGAVLLGPALLCPQTGSRHHLQGGQG